MENLNVLLQQGSGWLFIPTALLLGALHGLEPGHSKTMMAAFIVAIRGTIGQAVMLGLAATLSHTALVWLIAMLGLTYGAAWSSTTTEPYLQMISALLMIGVALWVMARTHREHHHAHPHNHPHADHAHATDHHDEDSHARAHREQINKMLTGKPVTTGQILLFGFTGGLIPCPAAITVLLLCLQVKKITLGATLVVSFSLGLAVTLVTSGVLAAWGLRHATGRWPKLHTLLGRAPYVSSLLIIGMALYLGRQGYLHLP